MLKLFLILNYYNQAATVSQLIWKHVVNMINFVCLLQSNFATQQWCDHTLTFRKDISSPLRQKNNVKGDWYATFEIDL